MRSSTVAPLVLLHSPWVGPATLVPLAEQLMDRGQPALVPDLRGVVDEPHRLAAALAERIAATTPAASAPAAGPGTAVLAHSGAGLLIPDAVRSISGPWAVGGVDASVGRWGAEPPSA